MKYKRTASVTGYYRILNQLGLEMELLRFVAQHGGLNIRQIAQELSRDYKNIYDDIQLLCTLGLLEKQNGKIFAPYDEVIMHYALRDAA